MEADALACLAALFPRAFFLVGRDRRPLKVGIRRDLCAADVGIPHRQLRTVLAHARRLHRKGT